MILRIGDVYIFRPDRDVYALMVALDPCKGQCNWGELVYTPLLYLGGWVVLRRPRYWYHPFGFNEHPRAIRRKIRRYLMNAKGELI
ncbi:MAG: hypothetical protein NWF07_13815 [Candidatus Bathyarchaeota archaeon]|nr:hypothetical protein [Candidatus Bathyarchaeota archaeon]